MRPKSIILFERLFLLSLAVTVIGMALSFSAASALLNSDPNLRRAGLGVGFLLGAWALMFIVFGWLWFLIARKASNTAKWVLTILIAISIVSLLGNMAVNGHGNWIFTNLLGIFDYLLEVAAVVFLFKPDAKAWLKGEEPDPATFE